MPYPSSAEVSAGMPTAAGQYNDLRADALRFGCPVGDAAAVGEMMSRYVEGLRLERLGTNRLRVPARSSNPVGIMIDGTPLCSVNNVDLPVGSAPTGAANIYYVFALRSPGWRGFSLDINTSSDESAGRRRIGVCYWDGSQIVTDSVRTEGIAELGKALGVEAPLACEGRLTLISGMAMPVNDVIAAGTVYFTPFRGDRIALFTPGVGWRLRSFSEAALSLNGLAATRCYDFFAYDQGGALKIEAVAWNNQTTRAVELGIQNGVYVRSGRPEQRYLGTLNLVATGQAEDSAARRFVWNYYNRLARPLLYLGETASWTYNVNAWRQANGSSAAKVELVVGVPEDALDLQLTVKAMLANVANAEAAQAIGVNSATTPGTGAVGQFINRFTGTSQMTQTGTSRIVHIPRTGWSFYAWLERSYLGANVFYGTDNCLSGLVGSVMA